MRNLTILIVYYNQQELRQLNKIYISHGKAYLGVKKISNADEFVLIEKKEKKKLLSSLIKPLESNLCGELINEVSALMATS